MRVLSLGRVPKGRKGEALENWLPLNDYANRYKLSVSTVRRRIKSKKVNFKLEDGKYLILDDVNDQAEPVTTQAPTFKTTSAGISHGEAATALPMKLLLEELKRAYLDSLERRSNFALKTTGIGFETLVMCLEKKTVD